MVKLKVPSTLRKTAQKEQATKPRTLVFNLHKKWNHIAEGLRQTEGCSDPLNICEAAILIGCVTLGAWLRWLPMSSSSLWRDEFYMLITSRRPFIQSLF